jgi:hypothetical protein
MKCAGIWLRFVALVIDFIIIVPLNSYILSYMRDGMKHLIAISMMAVICTQLMQAQEADGYYGILNANPALIDSISNESGTLTGDFSTKSLVGPVEHAQWATDGPVVVSTSGEVLGTLSTEETNTHSLFNETIYVQVPYTDRCEACIGSLNDNFSTVGPKIYDSQSSELKDKIGEVIGAPLQENP